MSSAHRPPPVPIDKAACISLVTNALADARERGGSSPDPGVMRPGVTINLSHQRIANIPAEVLEMIKDEIERLALAHNQLTSFSDEFALLPRLRYLNLRSNFLKEFPAALTRLPSLEILDVSRNRIRALPQDFGKLVTLKVLSMSKNRINILPTYIGSMNELKILKLDHNPIVFPPKEVLENEDADRDAWLESVKRFLKAHASKTQTTSPSTSSDEAEASDPDPDPSPPTIKPIPLRRRPHHLPTLPSSSPLRSPSLPQTPLSATERSRSNSESTSNRISRRMGIVVGPLPRRDTHHTHHHHTQKLKHTRGYSHDSAVHPHPHPGAYFRRLSSLPEHKRSSLSSARVAETARGLLYAMSTLQAPIEEFVQGADSAKLEIALYNGTIHVGALVGALEGYEERDGEAEVDALLEACVACVAAFRQVLGVVQSAVREGGGGGQDSRVVRTLLLMVYGSYVEVQSTYEVLRPLLGGGGRKTEVGQMAPTPPTPGEGGFDCDEPLYGKFRAATDAAIVTLPGIEREIRVAGGGGLQPSTGFKLREVAALCVTGTEAARRLSKIKWEAIQEGDVSERRRFWEDTNKFTNLVINIAELIKSVTQEYVFPKHILVAVGTVVRPTKDLYILMNGSAFRHMAEQPVQVVQGGSPGAQYSGFQSMTAQLATPLSAALGIATQATVPQGYLTGMGGGGGGAGSRSGTLLSQTHPTMTSAVSEVGMAFGKQQPLKLS